ncbi:MAG TPA: SRPBCC domain-containing protein [Candidatus Binataceae bacterium]|nr:SRPBCC domain-containing protein [Candidatus Binataceae bacterium]
MPARSSAATENSPYEFTITRIFKAPRILVWKAFTEPERLEKWWGAPGMTARVRELDLRPGGVFAYSQRAANGPEMFGRWVYREVVAPERLTSIVSFTDASGKPIPNPFTPNWPLEMLSTATFGVHQGSTVLTVNAAPHSASALECETFETGRESMEQGFGATFDRLDAYLLDDQKNTINICAPENQRALTIKRVFDAPRTLVFKAWTQPEHLKHWWGPHGFTIEVCELEPRVGGAWHIRMRSPQGMVDRQRGVIREFVEPERLVFTYAFEDDSGNRGNESIVTVAFADLGKKTEVTVHQEIFESVVMRDEHVWGWGEALDDFAVYLNRASHQE